MILLKTCCCGWTLRTSTMIIGYVQLIAFSISLITLIALCPGSSYNEKEVYVVERVGSYSSNSYWKTVRTEKEWPLNDALLLGAFFTGFLIIMSISLIVGATKGNIWLILPWISNTMFGVSFCAITWIYELIRLGGGSAYAALYTFIYFLVLVTSVFSLRVVVSHFEELRKELIQVEVRIAPKAKDVEERVLALESMVQTLGKVV